MRCMRRGGDERGRLPAGAAPLMGLVALALAFVAGGHLSLSTSAAAAPAPTGQCQPIALDFAGLPHGTILGEQFASLGIHISGDATQRPQPDALVVFDSNTHHRPDTHDDEVYIGNLAIIPNTVVDGNGDGLVDDFRDSFAGGTQVYTFDQAVTIGSFIFVDKDTGSAGKATAFDASGGVIATAPIPNAGNASVQTIDLNATSVRRLEIVYHDSGGVTGIDVKCPSTAEPGVLGETRGPSALPNTGSGSPDEAFPAEKLLAPGLVLMLIGAVALVGRRRTARSG